MLDPLCLQLFKKLKMPNFFNEKENIEILITPRARFYGVHG